MINKDGGGGGAIFRFCGGSPIPIEKTPTCRFNIGFHVYFYFSRESPGIQFQQVD